jgi:uncharacterized membrane protein YfcA
VPASGLWAAETQRSLRVRQHCRFTEHDSPMTILELTALVFCGSVVAGLVGSLTGLGGGIVITPLLTLLLGVDIRYAIGAALVSVIATSSGAAAAYVKEGFSNIRIGMFMEIATTTGAVLGATLALHVSTKAIAVVFGLALLYSAFESMRSHVDPDAPDTPDPLAQALKLDSTYPAGSGPRSYHVHHVVTGSTVMFGAGILSGLLGIGSGALKVIAMDKAMRIPFKVSTTTSNFMIGVTAAASVGLYMKHGYIDPGLAMPVVLGVLAGSFLGARLLPGMKTSILRRSFSVVIAILAVEMIYQGLTGVL